MSKDRSPVHSIPYDIAMPITQNLDLYMARLLDILFNEETVVAKACFRLGGRDLEVFPDILVTPKKHQIQRRHGA